MELCTKFPWGAMFWFALVFGAGVAASPALRHVYGWVAYVLALTPRSSNRKSL